MLQQGHVASTELLPVMFFPVPLHPTQACEIFMIFPTGNYLSLTAQKDSKIHRRVRLVRTELHAQHQLQGSGESHQEPAALMGEAGEALALLGQLLPHL